MITAHRTTGQDRLRGERAGFSIAEMVVAVSVAMAAMGAITQMLFVATRQHRLVNDQSLAIHEIGNLMEDLMSRPWSELVAADPPVVTLSDAVGQAIPGARVRLNIVPDQFDEQDAHGEDLVRIELRIDWTATNNQSGRPVRLVAWRVRDKG
jgi:hypothetical protein